MSEWIQEFVRGLPLLGPLQEWVAGLPNWILFGSIPVVAAIVAWTTNWLGIRMAFYPIRFVGPWDPWLGWQGIVPRRAWKMSTIAVDSAVTKLASLRELLEMMHPEEAVEYLVSQMTPLVPELVDEVANREYPDIWQALPGPVKQAVYGRCTSLLPKAAEGAMEDILEHVDSLLDARMMMIEELAGNPRVLVKTMMDAGKKEFWFLINVGAVFGALLGLGQMALTMGFRDYMIWIMPAFGIFVGYATNWLAFQMIFEPTTPRKIGPYTLYGSMYKRKEQIARHFARVAAHEFATLPKAVNRMLTGPNRDRVKALIERHARPLVDEALSIAAPAARVALGPSHYEEIKDELAGRGEQLAPTLITDEEFVATRAALVEEEMFRRLNAMTETEFQRLLRPAVEEDEWILFTVGGALGGLSGLAQAGFLLAGIG
jgi:uncharacterized membrane protein YheB (UPF0754 family)